MRSEGTYGYLALIQLQASAATDKRLSGSQRQALALLCRYVDPDGTCCVSMGRMAGLLGVTRQALQNSMRAVERCGYVSSERRYRATGAEGAKIYRLNLELEGAMACPVLWSDPASDDVMSPLNANQNRGVQPSGVAGACNRQELQGGQSLKIAHTKPFEETNTEETNACSARALRATASVRAHGKVQQRPASQLSDRQQSLLLPIDRGTGNSSSVDHLTVRIGAFNHERRCEVAGRMMREWFRLDGDALIYLLSDGFDCIQERAITAELGRRGAGVRYIAGAIEKATSGRITASDIMAGRHKRKALEDGARGHVK